MKQVKGLTTQGYFTRLAMKKEKKYLLAKEDHTGSRIHFERLIEDQDHRVEGNVF